MIEELIALAKEMREANARGEALRLTDDEGHLRRATPRPVCLPAGDR